MTKRPRISSESRAERSPLPPDVLASALQDRIHPPSGRLIESRPVAMTEHVTLFGRKMRKVSASHYELAGFQILDCSSMDGPVWFGWCFGDRSPPRTTPHAAARALERKIVAAHRRLGKLMAGTKGRSK